MNALAAPPRLTQLPLVPQGDGGRRRLRSSDGGRLTLEQRLDRVWEGLAAAGVAECPLCRSEMEHTAEGGRCSSCGTTLT